MPVAADNKGVWLRGDKVTQLLAFPGKGRIAVIVCLAFFVRAHDGTGTDDEAEGSVRRFHGGK